MVPTTRVAYRWLTGGIFEAPPVLLRDITDWATSIYAGHVLADAERRTETRKDDKDERIEQMQAVLDLFQNASAAESWIIKNTARGKILRIPHGQLRR